MEYFRQSAFPSHIAAEQVGQNEDRRNHTSGGGLTKIEYAAVLIAQGMVSPLYQEGLSDAVMKDISSMSVQLAKAILEEANK